MVETSAEFDAVADGYEQQHSQSIRLSGEEPDYFARYKIEMLKRFTQQYDNPAHNILDFGAGIGNAAPHISALFPGAAITALDVSQQSLSLCSARNIPNLQTLAYDGASIPMDDASQDVVLTACVFHHIEADMHVQLLREIRRILKPGGMFALFEHNPWNPLTRHAVANCPFDENAVLITAPEMRGRLLSAGFQTVDSHYCVFFPKAVSVLRPLEKKLGWLPMGAQYMLVGH
jgi:ubiquinone/menaquinone biosynthesis C-methylase UbiE